MVGHTACALQDADDFPLIVGDGKLVERADTAPQDHHDIRRPNIDDVPSLVAKAGVYHDIRPLPREAIVFLLLLERMRRGNAHSESPILADGLRDELRQTG